MAKRSKISVQAEICPCLPWEAENPVRVCLESGPSPEFPGVMMAMGTVIPCRGDWRHIVLTGGRPGACCSSCTSPFTLPRLR